MVRKISTFVISLMMILCSVMVWGMGEKATGLQPPDETIKSNDLIAHWKLDETSGSIAYDETGKHNGTNFGALVNRPGKIGTSYYFDGLEDYVLVNDYASLDFNVGEDFSIFTWINTTQKNYGRILEKYDASGKGYLMAVWNNGTLRTSVIINGGSQQATIYSPMDVADGQWHHVGMIRNGNTLEAFVDGVSVGSNDSAAGDLRNNNKFYIGTDWGEYWDYEGFIDDVRIFTYALTPDVISTYPINGGTDIFCNEPVCVRWNESMNTSITPSLTQIGGFDPGNWVFQHWSTTFYENDTATWSHDNWTAGDAITMRISGGQDAGGNPVFPDPYDWSFTVGLIPQVEFTNPVNQTIDVDLDSPYIIKFNKQMDQTVGTTEISPSPTIGSWKWDSTGMWYNFTGSGNLWVYKTSYNITLTNFQDLAGRSLNGSSQFCFTSTNRSSPFIYANKSGNNIRLEWADGIGPFEVYISNEIDGSGFNFSLPNATTSNDYWEHTNVLGNGNSYSYIVRAQGDSNNSNIAWKYAHLVQQPGNPNINWVSIPYVYEHQTLGDIGYDIGNAITWEVRCWDVANQQHKIILWNDLVSMWLGDTTYSLQPGDPIMVMCSQAPGIWDIVGAHNPNLAINIQQPGAPNINWVSLPYHHNYPLLGDVGFHFGWSISWEIRCWSTADQNYKIILTNDILMCWLGDTGYPLQPSDAIMVFCSQAPGTWTPYLNPIGP